MPPRLGWSAGIVGRGLMIGEAALTETTVDAVTKRRDDPSLTRRQPAVGVSEDDAFLGRVGTFCAVPRNRTALLAERHQLT